MIWFLLACSSPPSAPTPSASAPSAAKPPGGEFANVAPAQVKEVVEGDGRSYVHLTEATYDYWVSTPKTEVEVGEYVLMGRGPLRKLVHSDELGRDFIGITEIDSLKVVDEATARAAVRLEVPAGGVDIAGLFAKKAELSGKPVTVRARVVKANMAIFGKNWFHLRDDTGAEGANDLTVTTDSVAAVGDVVLVSGPLTLDKDLGFGYFFPAILENGSLKVEVAGGGDPGTRPEGIPASVAGASAPPAPGTVIPDAPAPDSPEAAPAEAATSPAAAPAGSPGQAAAPAPVLALPATAKGPAAPTRTIFGVAIGTESAAELDAWIAAHKLDCKTAPAPRRASTRTDCGGDIPATVLEGRAIKGKISQVLFSRTDTGPIHYLSASRRYSLPADAQADYDAAVSAITATLGAPKKHDAVDPARLAAKMSHFAADWTFGDLEVNVVLLRLGSPDYTVTETWDVPGVEAAIGPREGTTGHGDLTGRPPGWNPHVQTLP